MSNEDLKDLKVFSLSDSISNSSTTQFIVEGIIERPSLTIVYGAPGDLKKMESSGLAEVTQGNNKNSKLYSAPLNQQQEESGSNKMTTTDSDEPQRSRRD